MQLKQKNFNKTQTTSLSFFFFSHLQMGMIGDIQVIFFYISKQKNRNLYFIIQSNTTLNHHPDLGSLNNSRQIFCVLLLLKSHSIILTLASHSQALCSDFQLWHICCSDDDIPEQSCFTTDTLDQFNGSIRFFK